MKRLLLAALPALAVAVILTTSGLSGQGRVDSPGVMTPEGGVPALGSYKVPKTPWGEPDLQGTYNANDLQGIQMQRQPAVGTRYRLNDDEFKAARHAARPERGQRQQRRVLAGTRRGVRGAVWHRRRRRLTAAALARAREERQPRVLLRHRPAGRTDSGVDTRGAGGGPAAPTGSSRPPQAAERHRSRVDHRPQQLRPLHQHRRAELDHAQDLQLRQPHRAGAGLAGVSERDDPRDPRHPDRRPQASGRGPELDGHVGRPLGRRCARGRNPQHQARITHQRPAACRTRAC